MNLHKHQLYLLEQHRESFKIWSTHIRINTEGKSLIMKLGPHGQGLKLSVNRNLCRLSFECLCCLVLATTTDVYKDS